MALPTILFTYCQHMTFGTVVYFLSLCNYKFTCALKNDGVYKIDILLSRDTRLVIPGAVSLDVQVVKGIKALD